MRGSFNGKITGFHPVVKGSIPLPRTNYALVSLMVEVLFCNQDVWVRFLPRAPKLYSGRLVARTPAFQVGEAGSIPVRSTKLSRGVRVDEGLISRIRSFEYFPRNQHATVVLWVGHRIVYPI